MNFKNFNNEFIIYRYDEIISALSRLQIVDAECVAMELRQLAFAKESKDNISVVVLDFEAME